MALADPPVERVDFANGSSLLLFPNESETGKVYVRVRFGRGLNALPTDRRTPAFAADLALVASGIRTPKGVLGQEELDRLTGGRQIGLSFAMEDDAFSLSGITTAADLADQLKLIAAKLQSPAWDPAPVARARAVMLASYDALGASPDGVMARDLDGLLHAGDPRWGAPDRKEIEALTPAAFKALWAPLLASGPVEVQVFGDVRQQPAIDAVAATIGAMTPRLPATTPLPPVRFPAHVATPVTRTHGGQPNQAAAAIAWPTGAGSAGLTESRKLEVLAAVFRDRLLDRLRSQAGVSYSPNVDNGWPVGLPGAGGSWRSAWCRPTRPVSSSNWRANWPPIWSGRRSPMTSWSAQSCR
ncbi:M16 family metallopeptidase [Sphingomonas hankookensis]|uniref:M16 family metallopeptidase n=1 Tax=Sphingomonas hankookensis TaxID=563996 RepID=UPI003F79B270